MRQITKGIWAIDGLKMGRAYLIEERDQLTLVDTSSPTAAESIVRAIESIGHRVEDLRTIVATHYHYDHTGNAAALRERSGAIFCAHADDAPYIDGRLPWGTGRPHPLDGLMSRLAPAPFAISVDRELDEGDVLPIAGGLEVLHAPGHTPGQIALYSQKLGVLFAGDAFMNAFGLQLPPEASTHDMERARWTVRRLTQLDFDHALPGHGGPVLSRASEKLRQWAAKWL
jgi:glyoxylase-like metal-dependent hydrolase (beta-lactamase superfamily II)